MKKIIWIATVLLIGTMALGAANAEKIRVTVNNANVRSRPELTAEIVLKAAKGDVFTVMSREGDWYKVLIPAESGSRASEGYIHSGVADLVSGEETAESAVQTKAPAHPARPARTAVRPPLKNEKLFSGFFAKFGYMTKPAGRFGDRWLLDLGNDWGINPFLAVGYELQPYYRHFSGPNASDSILGANLFANVKGGVNIGRFAEKLKFLTPYIGFGLGGEFYYSSSKYKSEKASRADFNFAWHLMFGVEFALKNMSLVLEFQSIKVSVPELDPDLTQYFWMVGVRF